MNIVLNIPLNIFVRIFQGGFIDKKKLVKCLLLTFAKKSLHNAYLIIRQSVL